jgi:hypothetical protein
MMRRALAALAVCFVASIGPAQSAYRITLDQGGEIYRYIDKYTALRLSGGSVILDGGCFSACALVAGLIPADRICITSRAFLGFHSTNFDPSYSEPATRMMWRMLPESVRALVRTQGWDGESEHQALVFIEGDQLKTLFAMCEGE